MTAPVHRVPRQPAAPIRERSVSSLERLTPKRPARNHHLLLAPQAALEYLRPLLAELKLDKMVLCAPMPPVEELTGCCREWLRRSGPFQRIHGLIEWDGQHETALRHAWQTSQDELDALAGIRIRLICCRPVFALWLLVHFEEPSPAWAEASLIQTRVNAHLAALPGDPATPLHVRLAPLLGQALGRSHAMAQQRLNRFPDDTFPLEPGTQLQELITYWYKLARRALPQA
ncbi:MAG: hypothetical protein HQL95_12935 [Magnetococcales bacterium]|nr:hypothetical protein [Magnetococcales bacterium]